MGLLRVCFPAQWAPRLHAATVPLSCTGWEAGRAIGFCGGGLAKELHLAAQDAQLDPAIHEGPEPLVGGESLDESFHAVGSDEAADGPPAMDIGQFVVGAMPVRMLRMHTAAAGSSADLVLA